MQANGDNNNYLEMCEQPAAKLQEQVCEVAARVIAEWVMVEGIHRSHPVLIRLQPLLDRLQMLVSAIEEKRAEEPDSPKFSLTLPDGSEILVERN